VNISKVTEKVRKEVRLQRRKTGSFTLHKRGVRIYSKLKVWGGEEVKKGRGRWNGCRKIGMKSYRQSLIDWEV